MPLTASEISKILSDYIEDRELKGEPPMFSQMARRLGVGGKRGLDKLRGEFPEAQQAFDVAYSAVEQHYEGCVARICSQGSQENSKAANSAMFMLGVLGWAGTQQEEQLSLIDVVEGANMKVIAIQNKQLTPIALKKEEKVIDLGVVDADTE